MLLISNMYPSKDDIFYGIFVKNFEEELEKNGIIVDKVVIKGKGNTKLEKIKKYLLFFMKFFYKLYKNDYDIIYVHFIGLNLLPLFFKFNSKPVILNAHGSDVFVNSKISLFIQKLVTPLIKKANIIVVPSNYFQDIVFKKFNITKDKIFVSPSGGIDTELFKPILSEKKKDIFSIGYVSRIDKGKGWDTLLKAIYLLKQKNLLFRVLIIGSGAENDLMVQKIKDLNLNSLVEYLGAKPHDELPHYFNQMDVFAFTTRLAESLGLVGLEAMACGVPVVGSNIGGLPSYISDNNGKLFEVGNSEELAHKLEYFINLNKKDIENYKLNALNTAKKYDAKKVNEELTCKLFETSKKVYNEINT